jgi:hypothetical protein
MKEKLNEKEFITNLLRENVLLVNFTKKDGTERVMKCTLKEDMIPQEMKPKKTEKVVSEDSVAVARPKESISVFDVDVVGWRSFRFDSVKDITFT